METSQFRSKRPPKPKSNPIHAAVTSWHSHLGAKGTENKIDVSEILTETPKKWTVYEPMALLPAGSFTSEAWVALLGSCKHEQGSVDSLWESILKEISTTGPKVTHLAVTEGIPLHKGGQEENVLRSPTGLRMLYGDFGPSDAEEEDFENAFWVSTKQNGIYQTWAPRWTMFSRGNIKEKARLLGFPKAKDDEWAVDLYAGIGYFVFSYASLGFKILCWEINPWSVEGLRRAANDNRWSVRAVKGDDLKLPTAEAIAGDEQIVVFQESNERALERLQDLQMNVNSAKEVKHVNCGFLPTSKPMWMPAWSITKHSSESWLHLHDNVGVDDIDGRRASIQELTSSWANSEAQTRIAEVSHVEQVKTFAPGVWHCVFDVHIQRSSIH